MSSTHIRLVSLLLAVAVSPLAAVNITQFNTPLTENFDTLATATGSVMPTGWTFEETGSSANTTYGAGTGSSSTGSSRGGASGPGSGTITRGGGGGTSSAGRSIGSAALTVRQAAPPTATGTINRAARRTALS